MTNADVILAADVVYALECIPQLISTVHKFLSSSIHKMALFATTHRNRSTFQLFEDELERNEIVCDYKSQELVPSLFPCYFNQPRSDVRICTMRLR